MSQGGRLAIIAIGGNSLIIDEQHRTVRDQYVACAQTAHHIAELARRGHRVLVTHGNGPQVGFILRRSELARHELHEVPLDSCVADTQGAIGYQLQLALKNELRGWPVAPPVATVVTQVLVDAADPAFAKPSKPIGAFMDEATAASRRDREGWTVAEDAGRGWRRVVASPRPRAIIELPTIHRMLDAGVLVIAVGGGGIPVVAQPDGSLTGIEAVIDKDLASSLAAQELGADVLVISTAVEKVYVNFNKPGQRALDRVTLAEARSLQAEGHFAAGSMGPKVQAVIDFLAAGGSEAIITDPAHLVAAFEGAAGTVFVP